MDYENQIKKFGGLKFVYPGRPGTLTDEEINNLETLLGVILPPDYRHFLLNYGVCSPTKALDFRPFSENAEYIHPDDTGIPNFVFHASSVGVFFGNDDNVYSLRWNLDNYQGRIPPKHLPILTDGMGNLVIMRLSSQNSGAMYFWDHECEWDADDYLEETGNDMPEEVKFQNLWIIAYSFTDFFYRLILQE